MKKKFLAFFGVLLAAGTVNVFAMGLGAQVGGSVGNDMLGGAALTFKLDQAPCVFALDFGFGGNDLSVGLTADWWIQNPQISGPFYWYYGIGAAGGITLGDDFGLDAGFRALAGLDIKLFDNVFEIYAQAAWQPTVYILPDFNIQLFKIPLAVGFRFWF